MLLQYLFPKVGLRIMKDVMKVLPDDEQQSDRKNGKNDRTKTVTGNLFNSCFSHSLVTLEPIRMVRCYKVDFLKESKLIGPFCEADDLPLGKKSIALMFNWLRKEKKRERII